MLESVVKLWYEVGKIKLFNHLRSWNKWRKHSLNSTFYKFLVLIGFAHSLTYHVVKMDEKYKNMWDIYK